MKWIRDILFLKKKKEITIFCFIMSFLFQKLKLEYFWNSIAKCNFRTVLFPWYEYSLSYELSEGERNLYSEME